MVGYALVAAALLCGAVKGFCGKKAGAYIRGAGDSVFLSLVRMVLCVIIGAVVAGGFGTAAPDAVFLGVTALGGISNALFVILWLLAVRKNAYMTVDVFLTAGCAVPAVGCAVFFGETISPMKYLGFFLLLGAVILMALYGKKLKGDMGAKNIALLVLTGFAEGCVGLSQQMYKYLCRNEQANDRVYNLYVYVFSAVFLLAAFLFYRVREKNKTAKVNGLRQPLRAFPLVAIMAVCLFAYSLLQTMATTVGNVSSAVLYPMMKGGGMLLSVAMAAVFFKERITFSGAAGCVLAFAAMIVING